MFETPSRMKVETTSRLDWLREQMQKNGLRNAQIDSKVVPVILDIITEQGNKFTEVWKDECTETEKLKLLREKVRYEQDEVARLERRISVLKEELDLARQHRDHCEDYIAEFNKNLEECETAEGRDAMRTAQMFTNSVSVDTKYDNTAYIIGLAAILSGRNLNAVDELQKINKKLPDIHFKEGIKRI